MACVTKYCVGRHLAVCGVAEWKGRERNRGEEHGEVDQGERCCFRLHAGRYALARHADRRAGRRAPVFVRVCLRVSQRAGTSCTTVGNKKAVASHARRSGRYCAHACAARVGRLLRACRAKQRPRVLEHPRQRMRTSSCIGEASVIPSPPLAVRVVPRGRTPWPMPILIAQTPSSRGLERA